MHYQYIAYVIYLVVGLKVSSVLLQSFVSPLRSVPGPFLARLTSLWYFLKVRTGHFEKENIALHKKYGPIVRLTPNKFSIDDPDALRTIYNIHTKWPKSEWYDGWGHPDPKFWSMFTMRDEKHHSIEKRKFAHLYSMSSLVQYEPYVDECIELLHNQLDRVADNGATVNFCNWIRYFTWDVIATITYNRRFGFLQKGEDVNGLTAMIGDVARYGTLVGIYAWLHPWIFPLTSKFNIWGAGARLRLNTLLRTWIAERKVEMEAEKTGEKDQGAAGPQDFLKQLLEQHEQDPEKVTTFHAFSKSKLEQIHR